MTRSTNARLVVTDGTSANTASMLVELHGANLQDWLPKSPQGVNSIWSSTPYQDGKQLVSKSYDNVIDTFTLEIDSDSMDRTIRDLRKFIKLLEKAVTYWTEEYNTHKFWLEIRAECETCIRYALVSDYGIPEIDNPFAPPFEPSPESTLDELSLSIEHTIWTDSLEVGENCVELSTYSELAYQGSAFDVAPAQSEDDGTEYISPVNFSTVTQIFRLGADFNSGVRFRSVGIPQGAIIKSAYVRFKASANSIGDDCNVKIEGELSATPAIFSTLANFQGRVKTTADVNWSAIPHWVQGTTYDTDDISAIIQEIINQVAWVSGNNLALYFMDDGSTVAASRNGGSWDDVTYGPPYLYVTYEDPSTITPMGETDVCDTAQIASFGGWKSKGITHVYGEDGGVFGSNQVDNTLPEHDILGATPNLGDYLYVGRQDDNGGYPFPFNNVIFYLAVLGTDGDGHWEYYDGGGWSNLTYIDYEANDFARATTTLGFHIVIWDLPSDWEQTTINGVFGLWVRYVVASNGISSPHQAEYKAIYSVHLPEIIIDEGAVKGDIHAILDYLLQVHGYHDKLIIALKSYERTNGGQFTPYIPLRGSVGGDSALLPPDVRVEVAFSEATETTDTRAYAGRKQTWSPGGAQVDRDMIDLYLGTKTYAGRYHVYLRAHVVTAITEQFSFYLELYSASGSFYSETKPVYGTDGYDECIDLGMIAFPQQVVFEAGSDTFETRLTIWGNSTDAGEIDLYDVVIIPSDEGVFEILRDNNVTENMGNPYKVVTSNPKTGSYCFELETAGSLDLVPTWDEEITEEEMLSILGSSLIKPNEKYHLYFFSISTSYASGYRLIKQFLFPMLDKHQRYLFTIGDDCVPEPALVEELGPD